MRPLSAIEAIGPAWNHTSNLLLKPRNFGLALKIGFVAVFAQIGGLSTGSYNSSPGNFGHMGHGSASQLPPAFGAFLAAIVAIALVVVVCVLLLGLIFFYLGSRLQFVLFEVVLRRDTTIGPIWRRYGAATWRWMGLRLIFIVAALLCVAPILIPAIVRFVHMMPHGGSPQPDAMQFFTTFLGLFATLFLVGLIFGIIHVLLHDFGLPSMALESTPVGTTISRVLGLVRAEPGQVVLYLIMRFVMGLAGSICASIALGIGALLGLIPFGGVGVVCWLALRHAGAGGHILAILAIVVLGVVYLAIFLCVFVILMGYVITFLQAYALYFLGGRYAAVGQYLAPFWPPEFPYAGYVPAYPGPVAVAAPVTPAAPVVSEVTVVSPPEPTATPVDEPLPPEPPLPIEGEP